MVKIISIMFEDGVITEIKTDATYGLFKENKITIPLSQAEELIREIEKWVESQKPRYKVDCSKTFCDIIPSNPSADEEWCIIARFRKDKCMDAEYEAGQLCDKLNRTAGNK